MQPVLNNTNLSSKFSNYQTYGLNQGCWLGWASGLIFIRYHSGIQSWKHTEIINITDRSYSKGTDIANWCLKNFYLRYHLFTNFDADLSDLGKSGCRGIAIYLAECLHPFQVSYPSGINEYLWINISLYNNENLLVGNIYRSPSSDKSVSTNDLCNLLNHVCSTKPSYFLVVGDFNCRNIDWINGYLTNNEQLFYDTLQDCVLHQLVTQPTRIRPSSYFGSNEEAMIQNISCTVGLGSSDHTCIQFYLNCTATRS